MIKHLLTGETKPGTQVFVQGWIRTRRDSKAGISFLMVNDGSCLDSLQIVASRDLKNYETEILRLTAGCSVSIEGKLVASQGGEQSVEVQATQIKVIGWVEDPDTYPISPKHHTLEYLREYAHLRPRTNTISAVTRVSQVAAKAVHDFFDEEGFCWIHTPIVTTSDCEGAGQQLRVSLLDLLNLPKTDKGQIDFSKDFFGRETFLTVSGQLNVEGFCLAMSKVYTFGPTFRAENSNTTRHLAEFWMIEPEIAFANLNDVSNLAERLLKYVCTRVLDRAKMDMDFFAKRVDKNCILRLEKFIQSSFVTMDYTDAIHTLAAANDRFEYKVKWGVDLQTEHERYLAEHIADGNPVVVCNYPKEIKAFYMRLNDDKKTVAAMDILVPGMGEITGGSQREERLDYLEARMDEMKLDKSHYQWYLDLRRYGSVPHGGFGIGFERLLGYITGMANIRDLIPYPRTSKHAEF